MKKIIPLIIIVLSAGAYFIFGSSSFRSAPDINMSSLSGQTLNTLQRNNKPLLLTFWATTCSSCVKEMPHLIELQNNLSNELDIVGIAMYYDNIEHIHEMVKRRNINYNIVFDKSGDISKAFGGIRLTPTSFLITAKGEIIYQKIGDIDFKIIKAYLSEQKQG